MSAAISPIRIREVDEHAAMRISVGTPPDRTPPKAYLVLMAITTLGLLLGPPRAMPLNPSLDVSQYSHTSWGTREGLNVGRINAIAQTPDGYIWLGTEFGLYRFDGVRAVLWPRPGAQRLPSTYVRTLLAAQDGTLWIGTYAGLVSWKDGKLIPYSVLAGQEVGALLEDREGTIWAGTGYQTVVGKLCAIRRDSTQCYGEGRFGNAVYSLHEDRGGNLWVGSVNGVWQWKPGSPKFYAMPDRVLSLGEAENGVPLALMRGGVKQLAGVKVEAYPLPGSGLLELLFRDHDGSLWVGMQSGLLHVHQGKKDLFGKSDGLSGDVISAVFEDREGSIWVATDNGLDRFRESPVIPLSAKQGFLDVIRTASVLAARDGSIWLSNFDRLTRWKEGQITTYGRQNRKGSRNGPDEAESEVRVRDIVDSALADEIVGSLFEDHRGRIWASTIPRAVYFENGRFVPVNSTAPCKFIHSFAEDTTEDIWISAHEFLCHLHNGGLVEQIPWTALGTNDFAETLMADPVRGGLWLGFFKGGVKYLKDGQVRVSFANVEGLGDGRVNSLRLDPSGTVWAATVGGLSRIKDGRVTTLTSKNGLPCDSLDWAIEDAAHSLWLNMACGLVRISRTELDSWQSDPKRIIRVTVFDSSDGVKSHAFLISTTPHVAESADGRIWFSTWNGLSVLNPQHLPTNNLPPPVHIEQLIADGKTYDAYQGLRLPARVHDLTIDYTALSFVAPEKIRFRFKLENQDPNWREVLNDRDVQYSNLAPGKYTFRVIACNDSGVWNEQGDMLDFSIAPAYYQTNWFRALCAIILLLLAWAAYEWRLRQLHHQFESMLEARVAERTRIAREIHDTLIQSFHGLLLRFHTVSQLLPKQPTEAKEKLDSTIEQAAEAITEGRDAVQGLRESTLQSNDLALAISTLGEDLAADSAGHRPAFRVAVEGEARDLDPILRDEIYRIAAEALRNAFWHAQARQVEVEIRYDDEQFRLRVRDDGRGIDRALLARRDNEGHYGLLGMRERATLIGGQLTVWSENDAGTEVELRLPAGAAYTTARKSSWLSRTFAGKAKD